MIAALAPGFLAAGALFAALPVVLHLLSRRPPDREALPTARFLVEDRRTLLRPKRRPSDLPLLVVRVLFALVLGAAFAGVYWAPERTDSADVLLVDVEAARVVGLDSLTAAVGAAASGGDDEARIVTYAMDETGALVTGVEVEPLLGHVGGPAPTAADGLRALRSYASTNASLDSATVGWVLVPTWRQWAEGLGLLREALWPGAITLHPLATAAPAAEATGPPRVVTIGFSEGAPLVRALEALGTNPVFGAIDELNATDHAFVSSPTEADLEALASLARGGATIVVPGTLQGWDGVDFPSGISVGTSAGISLSTGTSVLAVGDDALPIATATRVGSGCVVHSGPSVAEPEQASDAPFVDLVNDLLHGCLRDGLDAGLDPGALAVLERSDLPTRIDVATIGPTSGTDLTRLFLLLALALLGTEVLLTRRRRG